MPFDALTTMCVAKELNASLCDGRIDKIYMPSRSDIVLSLRAHGKNLRLLLSCNPSFPRVHFTFTARENPQTPPGFCMLLRKYLTNGKIISVKTPGIERIIIFEIECKNELADTVTKKLIVELFGKNSNIILLHENGLIGDSIRHIDNSLSRDRIILPGLPYFPPTPQNKLTPNEATEGKIKELILKADPTKKADSFILENFMGLSPLICREIVHLWAADSDLTIGSKPGLSEAIHFYMERFADESFTPVTIWDKSGRPIDFSCINIRQYGSGYDVRSCTSLTEALDDFFSEKEKKNILREKGGALIKTTENLLARCWKKAALQEESLLMAEDSEKYKIYGELITANIYKISKGDRKLVTENYYLSPPEEISIALDHSLTPAENAQKYFKKYTKLKNTAAFAREQYAQSLEDIKYLESVLNALTLCETSAEIEEIREELILTGYIKEQRHKRDKKQISKVCKPSVYKSSDGFTIYVGKNNRQNDYLTLKLASSKDIWFHTKDVPGSHTVISCAKEIAKGEEIPDRTYTEAALLAAYFSKARGSSQIAVDYCPVKNIKKPAGAKPGMVIYDGFYTAYVTPTAEDIEKLKTL